MVPDFDLEYDYYNFNFTKSFTMGSQILKNTRLDKTNLFDLLL